MTDFDFSDFDALLNKDALKEIDEATAKKPFDNTPLPENNYMVTIEKLELTVTKKGMPAVMCDFKIKDGEYAGRHEFYWLNLTKADGSLHGFKVHLAHTFLNSLTGDQIKCNIKDGFETFGKEISQVFEFAKGGYYEIKLSYNSPKNSTLKFTSIEPINFFMYEK